MNTRPLSIYLLKANAAAPNHVLKESPDIQRVQIGQGQHTIGTLFHRPTPARSPRWVSFFQPHVDTRDFLASSTAAVFLVQASRRWFALTFGQGRHLLAPGVYEENFGLRATLNSVNPDHIRVI